MNYGFTTTIHPVRWMCIKWSLTVLLDCWKLVQFPGKSHGLNRGLPMNVISKRPYRGINLWLLLSLNYERNLFLTWDQLKKIGGSVLQGQHGHIVIFWKQVKKAPEELDDKGKPKMVSMLRYYKVFNVEQCRDIPKGFNS